MEVVKVLKGATALKFLDNLNIVGIRVDKKGDVCMCLLFFFFS